MGCKIIMGDMNAKWEMRMYTGLLLKNIAYVISQTIMELD
jgi:hypothetical protein